MTVLHIVDEHTPADMLDQLSLLASEGDRIVSVGPPPRWTPLGLPVEALHCPLGVAALGGLYLRNAAGPAETLHFWSPRTAAALRTLPPRPSRTALLSLPACPPAGQLRRLGGLLAGRSLGGALRITLPTRAACDQALAAGLPEAAVAILPPPAKIMAADELSNRRAAARAKLGLADHQALLVAPNEMQPHAGHKYASWVHAILRQIIPDVLLAMPFAGPAARRVEWFAHTTGYDNEVTLPARWPAQLAPADALAAADVVLLLGSRDTGVASLAAAMAAGRPIVATDLPQHRELAPHEQAALLTPLDDPRAMSAAALRLLEDGELSARLSAAAQEIAGRLFDPSACRTHLGKLRSPGWLEGACAASL